MALDALVELAGAALRPVLRIVFEVLFQLVFGVLMYYSGWVLLKPFYRGKEPGENLCMGIGTIFWILAGAAALTVYFGMRA